MLGVMTKLGVVDFDAAVVEKLEVLLVWGKELESEQETPLLLGEDLVAEDEVVLAVVVELEESQECVIGELAEVTVDKLEVEGIAFVVVEEVYK